MTLKVRMRQSSRPQTQVLRGASLRGAKSAPLIHRCIHRGASTSDGAPTVPPSYTGADTAAYTGAPRVPSSYTGA